MITKRITLSLLFVCLAHIINAQRIENLEAVAVGSDIRITFSLQSNKKVDISLQYSDNNGLTFYNCQTVRGDLENQKSGEKKTLFWDCGKDGIIMGNFVFKVTTVSSKNSPKDAPSTSGLIPIKEKTKQPDKSDGKPVSTKPVVEKKLSEADETKGRIVIMPGISVDKTLSYSLMVGYAGKWGGYIKAKSNFVSDESTQTIIGEADVFFNSEYVKSGRSAFSAGLLTRLVPSCYLYVGAGYGTKWVQWKDLSDKPVKIDDRSFSGFEPETGVIYKIQRFAISGGVSALFGKQTDIEASIGIGFTF